jgi:hypothetical protein
MKSFFIAKRDFTYVTLQSLQTFERILLSLMEFSYLLALLV